MNSPGAVSSFSRFRPAFWATWLPGSSKAASHPVLTPTPESGAVDLVDGLPVVVELRDGFVQPLEQRIQRFPLPANEHGHAVVAVCGCGCACDRVERAQCDVATVSDE